MKRRVVESDEMSDTEMWRAVRHYQAEQRLKNRDHQTKPILELASHGYTVKAISEYCYRVNGVLDLFPTRGRYHHIPTNRRGGYRGEGPRMICLRMGLQPDFGIAHEAPEETPS